MFRRRLTALVCSVAALGLLATGCGDSDGGTPAAEKGTGKITFWSFVKGSDKVAEAFNRSHPDIEVTFEAVPSGQEYYSKLTNAVKAGTVPDVAVAEFAQLPEFATQETGRPERPARPAGRGPFPRGDTGVGPVGGRDLGCSP